MKTRTITPNFRQPAKPKNNSKEPPVSDARIAEWVNDRSRAQLNKLDALTERRTRIQGFSQCRRGGPVWEEARKAVISGLIRSEADIDEIILEDDD